MNLSKSLAQEFDGGGIRLTASLRACRTDLWLGEHCVAETLHARATRATARDGRAKAVATGRFSAREGRDLITILASERTANPTSVNYFIDGGLIRTT